MDSAVNGSGAARGGCRPEHQRRCQRRHQPERSSGRDHQSLGAHRFSWITSPPLLQELDKTLRSPRLQRYLVWTKEGLAEFLALVRQVAGSWSRFIGSK